MALAAVVTVMGGMTAATATPSGSAASVSTSSAGLHKEREKTLNGPRAVQKKANVKDQKSCEKVRREAAGSGERKAMCVELVDATESRSRSRLNSTESAAAGGVVWCDGKDMGTVYVTRVSICESQMLRVTVLNTQTGAPLGVAFLTVKQEINTREVDGKPLPLPGSFHEDFYMQVQGASGVLAGGFSLEVDAECAPTSQCQQGEAPWSGPVPVTILSELEGTWNRVWAEPVGNATMMLAYTVTVSYGGHKESHNWGINESSAWEVRCDKEIGTVIGCIVPAYTPTFVVNYLKYPAGSDYIDDAQAYIETHPGREESDGSGLPLHREADTQRAQTNRNRVCDRTFVIEDRFNGAHEIQCDEYPFARSKEGGATSVIPGTLGRGTNCKQFVASPGYADFEPRRNHTMLSHGVSGSAPCARASMPKVDNEGIGGDLGRFFPSQRMLDGDAFWVDAMSWSEYCNCVG